MASNPIRRPGSWSRPCGEAPLPSMPRCRRAGGGIKGGEAEV